MKLLLVISVLALSACCISASFSSEACAKQDAAKAAIAKLTPTGQQTILRQLQTYQFFLGAALQPVYEYLGEKFKTEIASVNATDAAQLEKLGALLGVGNYVILQFKTY